MKFNGIFIVLVMILTGIILQWEKLNKYKNLQSSAWPVEIVVLREQSVSKSQAIGQC